MKKHDEEKIIYLGIALENNSLQKKLEVTIKNYDR